METYQATRPLPHVRRHPEKEVLYRIIYQYLPAFRDLLEQNPSRQTPRFVLREFDKFLGCGVLARGFARVRCPDCKSEELLAFSCKRRGFCPSCGARRMAQQAAHLLDQELRPVVGEDDQALASLASKALMGPRTIGARAAAWVTHLGRDPHAEVAFAQGKHSAALHGFSLYVGPSATHRIEQLARYIAHPPIATTRLSLTASGKVLYKLKRRFKDGTHS